MVDYIKALLQKEKIEYFGVLGIEDCEIINRPLFERNYSFAKSLVVFLIPYFSKDEEKRNISLYCVPKDYHLFVSELRERLCLALSEKFPNNRFAVACDHSPINETSAAALAGLGIIGDNTRLINQSYGSFVFISEIYTDFPLQSNAGEIARCEHCGICASLCPCKECECLSSLTQKKGKLTDREAEIIKKNGSIWGCDICQLLCPHNKNAKSTPIDFFTEDLIYTLTPEILQDMSEQELKKRAFGWRGRKTLERNIKLFFEE